jgi:uncharacterized protein YjiS (DUF1127 family)
LNGGGYGQCRMESQMAAHLTSAPVMPFQGHTVSSMTVFDLSKKLSLGASFARFVARSKARTNLYRMSDRELADIGLYRDQIPRVLKNSF